MDSTPLLHAPYGPRFGDGVRQEPSMERRTFMALVSGSLLAVPLAAEGQQAERVYRIGVLSTADGPEWEAFRQGLRTLGYIDGRNLFIEYRCHAGTFEKLPALAAELVDLKVALIVTAAPQPTRAAKAAGSAAAAPFPRLTFYWNLVFHQSDFNSPVPEPAALSLLAFGFAVVVAGPAP